MVETVRRRAERAYRKPAVLHGDGHAERGVAQNRLRLRLVRLVRDEPEVVGEAERLVPDVLAAQARRRRVQEGGRVLRIQEARPADRFDLDVFAERIDDS